MECIPVKGELLELGAAEDICRDGSGEAIGPEAEGLQGWEEAEGLGWDAPHQSPPW